MVRFQKKMSAFDALLAPLSDPYGSVRHLMIERERPPYLLFIFTTVLAVLLGPPFWYQVQFGVVPRDSQLSAAVTLTLVGALGLFTISSTVFLRLLRISISLPKMIASICYSLTPIVPLVLGMYAANYALDGHASLIEYYAVGTIRQTDVIFEFLPYAFAITACYIFVVFINCLTVLGNGSLSTSFVIALVTILILFGSFFTILSLTDTVFPGYSPQVKEFMCSLIGPTNVTE
jgi:hypothetical protein